MIKPKAPFQLTPLPVFGSLSLVPLTIDLKHIPYLLTLPYIGQIFINQQVRDHVFVYFDARYDQHEAWHELFNELVVLTSEVPLSDVWEECSDE